MKSDILSRVAVLVAIASLALPAAAQEDAEEYKEPELVLRFYEITDLISHIPDFGDSVPRLMTADALATFGRNQSVSEFFSDTVTVQAEESGTEQLRDIIEGVLQPEEQWSSQGGRSTIHFLARTGKMAVRTTEPAHKELAALLNELRPTGLGLMIDVQVVELDTKFVSDTYANGKFVFKGPDELRTLAKASTRVCARASLCAVNGQRVWHAVNDHMCYLGYIDPIVVAGDSGDDDEEEDDKATSSAAIAYSKSVSYAVDGLIADVTVALSPDRSSAQVNYRFQYAQLMNMKEATEVDPALPEVLTDDLKGTACVPLGSAVLLASGQSAPTGDDAEKADAAPSRHFILTVHLVSGK